ncbi:DUF488 domain-containing protein [Novosphingobium sp. ZN18A2]|uniref:DUF488 domain-containing protein n=1 Tax=Novosphingobium sp. ZN18A2 TaxID=3079861 RepID=UPI0030CFD3F4
MTNPVHTIWSIGYEHSSLPQVIGALVAARVEVLADVRALPLSRRPGFSKTALAAAARDAGIEYRHFKPLGTPADGRAAARAGDHAALERIYAGQLELPEAIAAGAMLADLAAEKRVAMICVERDAACCHRTLLRKAMLPDFAQVDLVPLDPV